MLPIIFSLGPLHVYSFGLMMAIAFLVTGFLFRKELIRANFSGSLADAITIGAMLGGIFGAKVYSVIEGLHEFGISSLKSFFSGAGLVWYGGFIGGAITVLIIIRYNHAPTLRILDLVAPMLVLGYAFGRMGCFLSGDGDYGPPTDLPWGMAFPNGIVPTTERVHPTPLYEIALSLIIFAFLWKRRKRSFGNGWMFGMYLILTGIERFITEFWRNTPKVLFGITMAQIIGIVVIIIGIALIYHSKKEPEKITRAEMRAKSRKN